MILVDYSGTAVNAILAFRKELQAGDEEVVNLIRHVVLTTLQGYKRKYGREYGEIVIACDARSYWRKDVFPFYKADRKKAREASDTPWKLIFDTLGQLRQDIIDNFPYRVIHVDKAEADDVIAVLCEWTQENDLKQVGLFEEPQPTIIVSADHDFKQLHRFDNIRQWSPITKKFVKAEKDYMKVGHIAHIVKGDSGDGIPNILSPDNIFTLDGVRQSNVSAKRLVEFQSLGKTACRNDEELRCWDRNETMVDFKHIPKNIKEEILAVYISSKPVHDKNLIMNYLIKNKCRMLLNNLEDF